MPASLEKKAELTDIILIWPKMSSALAEEIVFGSALYRWRLGEGPRIGIGIDAVQKPWEDLTNQEKLDIVYRGMQRSIIAEARTALVDTGVEEARDTASDYADDNYELPE